MGLTELDRVELVVEEKETNRRRLIAVEGLGWPVEREALDTACALLKLSALLDWAERQPDGKVCKVELYSQGEPPKPLVEWLHKRGVNMTVEEDNRPRPVRGRPATLPWGADGEPDAGALMLQNARAFAEAHGAPWPPTVDGVSAVDAACEAWREARGMTPEQEDPDAEDGMLTVTGGAYAGEALRLAAGGAWAFTQKSEHMRAFTLRAGPQQNVTVNVLGKVQKHLRAGASDSTLSLVRVVVGRLKEGGF